MAKPGSLTADRTLTAGIKLLEALSAAPDHRLDVADAAAAAGIGTDDLPAVVDTIGALSDRMSGARAAIETEGDQIHLYGDAALLMPLRLSVEESMIVSHMIDLLDLDPETRQRIREGIMPDGDEDTARGIAETSRYGSWLAQLSEAIQDGVRCQLTYRSLTDDTARTRTVDPLRIDDEQGRAYLIAWDVERDEERRYRLDRIADVTYTDDSVAPHEVQTRSTAESLRAHGDAARLVAADEETMRRLTWSGIGQIEARVDGSCLFTLYFSSRRWLFDQVLAAGGNLQIVEPREFRDELRVYAAELLASIDG